MKMRFKYAFYSLLLGVGMASCTSETELLNNEGGVELPSESGIRFVIQTPSPDDIVAHGSRTAEPAIPPYHTDKEYAVKKMSLYMFAKKAEATGEGDDQYELIKKKEEITFKDAGEPGVSGTDNKNGQLAYTEPITKDMLGKTVKILLVANDKAATATEGAGTGTTLQAFKQNLATAVLTEGASADVISGNIYAKEPAEATGLVMSATAYTGSKEGENEAVKLTPMGVEMKAAFLRAVARVDFVHNTPNLTVKELKIKNVASKGYLFKQNASVAAPSGADKLTILPTSGYTDKLSAGIKFVPQEEEGEPTLNPANNLKHVFYLYEQENSEGVNTCATIYIKYSLEINGKEQEGELELPFKKTGDDATYVHTTRNTLYTVIMGNGERAEDINNVTTIKVADWSKEEIEEPFDPDKDNPDIIRDPKKAQIGYFYLNDGTFRKSDHEFSQSEKSKVIGIVFQTNPDRIGQAEKTALTKEKGVAEAHGLVMAVKCANGGKKCAWKSENTTSGLTPCETKSQCYNDISGLANWQTVETEDAGFAKHPAFKAVADFAKTVPAPENTTGWFLPSIGQWWDIVATLGNNKKAQDRTEQEGSESTDNWSWQDSDNDSSKNTADVINEHLNKIGASYVDLIEKSSDKQLYWTSSEYSATSARYVDFNSTNLRVYGNSKQSGYYIRAVLAY